MHNWNDNYNRGFDGGHLVMMLTMLAFWGLVVWGAVMLYRRTTTNGNVSAQSAAAVNPAQVILDERLAKGDISEADYKSRSQALKGVFPEETPST